ncbi:hypothetical protein [Gryllotalpicola koreensis]|uniref:CidA/LrgA family protein n=1 Tax=Gryllotalpicola koreensis TaxID=993086 RepID=A0ABP8ACG7_9MICO
MLSFDGREWAPLIAKWPVAALVVVQLLLTARLIAHWLTTEFETLLAGVLGMMLLIQLMLVGHFRRAGAGFRLWTFTFPIASSANFALRWSAAADCPGWHPVSWVVLALASAAFLAIVAVTATQWTRRLRGARWNDRAEEEGGDTDAPAVRLVG